MYILQLYHSIFAWYPGYYDQLRRCFCFFFKENVWNFLIQGISQEDSTISEASSSLVKILSSNPILDTSQPAVLSHSSSKSDESSSSSSLCDNVSLSSDDDEEEEDGECAGRRLLKLPPLLFDHDSEDQSSSKPFHTCHLCGLTYRSQEMLRNHYSHAHIGHKNVFVCLVGILSES